MTIKTELNAIALRLGPMQNGMENSIFLGIAPIKKGHANTIRG